MRCHKRIILGLVVVAISLSVPSFVFSAQYKASNATSLLGKAVKPTGVSQTDVQTITGRVVKAGLAITGLLFFILAFYGGFSWLIARGNEEQIKKAKDTIIGSIIGLVIVISSYALTNFIFTRVVDGQSGGSSDAEIPDAVEGDEKGCCLDRWKTDGGYFGAGQSGWVGTVLTQAQCAVKTNTPDYAGQEMGSDWGDWIAGITEPKQCQEAAQLKDKNGPSSLDFSGDEKAEEGDGGAFDFSGSVDVPDSGANKETSKQSEKYNFKTGDGSEKCCNQGIATCMKEEMEMFCLLSFNCTDGPCE